MHLEEHHVGFGSDLRLPPINRSPMRSKEAQTECGEFGSEGRALLRESLKLPTLARAKVLQVRGSAADSFLEDLSKTIWLR